MARRKKTAITGTTGIVNSPVLNAALPASSGSYRTLPTWQPWSNKHLERIQRSKDIVQISRYLQSENGIPQVRYACRQLPREAVGKGIGAKSISQNPDFQRDATALFSKWADSPAVDLRKEQTFFQLQSMWLAGMLGDGENFILPVFDPAGLAWSLNDKSKRAFQLQTITRDQLTNGDVKDTRAERCFDGLFYNGLDQLVKIRLNQDDTSAFTSGKYIDIPAINALGHRNVFHLKDPSRINQYHGDPAIFAAGPDLLDVLDLKALRKHSAKVRAALLGATTTKDGKVLNAMQQVLTAEQSGNPAADTGRRFVEIGEGAIFIPLSSDEQFNFFTNPTEGVPFKQILEDLLHPFIFEFGYPPEWIFMRGKVGGTEYRGLLEQVKRAHEGLRSKLYPLIQWIWEKVIGTAMMPGGALSKYAQVEDWNVIDFVTDPDPSADAGRDHKAKMEQLGENLITPDDLVEMITGANGTMTRRAAIDQKIDLLKYAVHRATGQPIEQVTIPASIALILGLGQRTTSSSSSMLSTLSPEAVAQDLTEMDARS
ncbi:MAG: hypothetical protein KCHDKBKB_03014 [Elusimicrobia bacterium]|nr:hypothetical protein [Elusimicrobiota bacterium]